VTKWTVVGGSKLTILATPGGYMWFITLSEHLCPQHDAREAARRAGPSATANKLSGQVSLPTPTFVC